jgi:hypothetical protein
MRTLIKAATAVLVFAAFNIAHAQPIAGLFMGAAGLPVTKDTYTSSGTATWNKPTPCNVVAVVVYGAGGSGGGGVGAAAGSFRNAGSGGGGGVRVERLFLCSDITSSVTVTVGTGGAAPAAGVTGNSGTSSSFGAYLTGYFGFRGSVGVSAGNTNGGGVARSLRVGRRGSALPVFLRKAAASIQPQPVSPLNGAVEAAAALVLSQVAGGMAAARFMAAAVAAVAAVCRTPIPAHRRRAATAARMPGATQRMAPASGARSMVAPTLKAPPMAPAPQAPRGASWSAVVVVVVVVPTTRAPAALVALVVSVVAGAAVALAARQPEARVAKGGMDACLSSLSDRSAAGAADRGAGANPQ